MIDPQDSSASSAALMVAAVANMVCEVGLRLANEVDLCHVTLTSIVSMAALQ